jgi:hypothetical protein
LFVTVIGGYRQLDTSVEASEPHDFAVRRQATSSARRFGAVNAAEYRSPYGKNASISDISEILQHIGAYLPAPTRNGYLPDCYWHVLASISVRTRARRVLGPLFAK